MNKERDKYTKIFNSKDFDSQVRQLKCLTQWLSNPGPVLFKDPIFFKNLLHNYLKNFEHGNQRLVFVLQALLAIHLSNVKGQDREECLSDFNLAYLRITYIGLFEPKYLCSALACLQRFIGVEPKRVYELFKVKPRAYPGLDKAPETLAKSGKRTSEYLTVIRKGSSSNGLSEPINKAFNRCEAARVRHVNVSSEVALQLLLTSEGTMPLADLASTWQRLFNMSMENERYVGVDRLSLCVLRVITRREGGVNQLFRKVSLTSFIEKLQEITSRERKLIVLKSFLIALEKFEGLGKEDIALIVENILQIMFVKIKSKTVVREGMSVLRLLTPLIEKDQDIVNEVFVVMSLFLQNHQEVNERAFADSMAAFGVYLHEKGFTNCLNLLFKVLLKESKYKVVVHLMGHLPLISEEVSKLAVETVQDRVNLKRYGLSRTYEYIYAYVKTVSRRDSVDTPLLKDLVSVVQKALTEVEYRNRGGVFVILANILVRYSEDDAFPREYVRDSFVKFCMREGNSAKEIQFSMKLFADVGSSIESALGLLEEDISHVFMHFADYLSVTRHRGEIETLCQTLDVILREEDNIICKHPGIKKVYLDILIQIVIAKEDDFALPLVRVLLANAKNLGLGQADNQRIFSVLTGLFKSSKAVRKPIFYECLTLVLKEGWGSHNISAIGKIFINLARIGSVHSINAFVKISTFLDKDALSALHKQLSSQQEEINYLYKDAFPEFSQFIERKHPLLPPPPLL